MSDKRYGQHCITHGHCRAEKNKRSTEYLSWRGMRDRCYNPNATSFPYYGARGIRVCDRWKASFAAFYEDMGPKPAPRYSLDRIDPDGDYSPGNCRWASVVEQRRNRRDSRDGCLLTLGGVSRSRTEWSRALGGSDSLIDDRLAGGWSVEKALTVPARRWRPQGNAAMSDATLSL